MWQRRVAARAGESGWTVHATVTGEGPGGAQPQALIVLSGGGAWGHAHRALLQGLRESWTGDAPLSLAAGEPAQGLAGLQKSLAEAQDALALGRRLSPGAGGDYLHREMGVYRLLRHLQGTADLDDFLNGTLGALAAYDREHGAELMATLEVLLAHGGNVSATARAMHLHRNSVIYRVERIRDVSGLDPTDAEDAFVLRLASMVAPLA
jgi:purine catabolism regulator